MVALAVLCVFTYVSMHACGRQRSNLGAFEEPFILGFFVTGFLLDLELTDYVSLVARKLAPGAHLFSGSSVLGLLLGMHTFFYLFTFYLTLSWALDSSLCTCKATLSTLPSPHSYFFFFTLLILPSFTGSHYGSSDWP